MRARNTSNTNTNSSSSSDNHSSNNGTKSNRALDHEGAEQLLGVGNDGLHPSIRIRRVETCDSGNVHGCEDGEQEVVNVVRREQQVVSSDVQRWHLELVQSGGELQRGLLQRRHRRDKLGVGFGGCSVFALFSAVGWAVVGRWVGGGGGGGGGGEV